MKIKSILVILVLSLMAITLTAAPAVLSYMDLNGKIGTSYKYEFNDDTSDANVHLNNFDIAATFTASDFLSAYIGFIYDDSMDYLEVDEAYANARLIETYPLSLTAGKFYLPTSISLENTNFICHPMTYSFTEMQALALMADFSWQDFMLSTSIYKKGQDQEDEDTNLDAYVINLAYEKELPCSNISLNMSYISNLYNSSAFADLDSEDDLSAVSSGLVFKWNKLGFLGEYVMTLDEYKEEKPTLMYAEISYKIFDKLNVAGNYSMSENAEDFHAESSFGAIINYTFMENSFSSAKISAEYIMEQEYDEEKNNTTTLKLTYKF